MPGVVTAACFGVLRKQTITGQQRKRIGGLGLIHVVMRRAAGSVVVYLCLLRVRTISDLCLEASWIRVCSANEDAQFNEAVPNPSRENQYDGRYRRV